MKHIITLLLAFIVLASNVQAQQTPVKDTIVNNVRYKLYVGSRGGRYIIVKSKAGHEYKRYFSKKK